MTLLLAAGSILRAVPFFLDRSLWLDEAKLALNVLDRPVPDLLKPLDYGQAAPAGFLFLEKLAVMSFGEGERALRLVPLLASLGSLWLFHAVVRRWLPPAEALLGLALFALSQPLVYYSTEVKPYSTDVLVALALLWAAGRVLDSRPAALGTLAAAGVIAVWLSLPAIFVAAGLGLTLTLWAWHRGDRPTAARFALVAAAWGASFLAHYVLVLRHADATGWLVQFWAEGFPPMPPRSAADFLWPVRTFLGFFADPAGLGLAGLAAAAFALGCGAWGRRDPRLLALLVSPAVFTLAAAIVRRYPFPTSSSTASYPLPGRLILFLVPAALILVASGLGWMLDAPDRGRRLVGGVMATLLLASLATEAVARPAYRIRLQEFRPLVAVIAGQGRPGDVVVLNTRMRPVYGYYSRRLSAADGVVRGLSVVELPGTNRWQACEARLQALSPGARVWLLYGHHPSWRSEQDEAFALRVLDRRGQRRAEASAPGASLHLYQLSGAPAPPPEPGT